MRTSVILLALFGLSHAALATDLPLVLSQSGYLLDAGDRPVSSPAMSFTFSFWNHATDALAANRVWPAGTPPTCVIAVQNGLYSVRLGGSAEEGGCGGTLTTAAIPFGVPRYLEVTVDGVRLLPRLRLDTVPHAAMAGLALSVVDGAVTNAMLVNSKVKVTATGGLTGGGEVALGEETTLTLAPSGVTAGQYALATVTVDDTGRITAASAGTLLPTAITLGSGLAANGAEQGTLGAAGVLSLTPSGVTAGVYKAANVTIDAYGRVTAAANGSAGVAQILGGTGLDANLVSGVTTVSVKAGGIGSALLASDAASLAQVSDGIATATKIGGATPEQRLDVAGAIKIGSIETCDAARAGAIRYSATGGFQGCHGGRWISLMGAPLGTTQSLPAINCKEINDAGSSRGSGLYWIDPDGATGSLVPAQAYCDMENDGGGWTQVAFIGTDAEGKKSLYGPVWSNAVSGTVGTGSYKLANARFWVDAADFRYSMATSLGLLDSRTPTWGMDIKCAISATARDKVVNPGTQNQAPAAVTCKNIKTGAIVPNPHLMNYQLWDITSWAARFWVGNAADAPAYHGDYCTDCVVTWKTNDNLTVGVYNMNNTSNQAGAFWVR